MKTQEKVFSRYIMSYENDIIVNVIDNKGKNAMFSFTFYNNNKDTLDYFSNIKEWVKPKKEMTPRNNIVINLNDYSVNYSMNNDKVSEEDLRQAMKILKNEMSEANPEIAKQKALLIKFTNDVKVLKDLSSEDMDFSEEIEEIEEKIEATKEAINKLLED